MGKNIFNLEKGIGIYDEEGTPLVNILAGNENPKLSTSASRSQPNELDLAPVGSLYLLSGTQEIYQKSNNSGGSNDWILNSSGPVERGLIIRGAPCEAEVYPGAAVKMSQQGIVQLALADTYENANVIGLVEEKISETMCDVRLLGLTGDIFMGLNTSEEYYLSDIVPGGIVPFTDAPRTAEHIRLKLGQPFSENRFVFLKGDRIVKG